jgi:hypothetical protein
MKNATVITSLNLTNGSVRQTLLDMASGHAAMSLLDGRILCVAHHANVSMVLDPNHNIIARLVAPHTHVYGGHGLVLPDRGIFIMSMRSAEQRTLRDAGRMQVYDLQSIKLLDEIATDGLHPHEVHLIPGADELVTTHYGDIGIRRRPYEHNVVDAKLTILDARTLKPKRHYPQMDFNALVTHMRVDREGWAYFVMTQYVSWPDRADLQLGQDAYAVAVANLDRALGRKHEFQIPYSAIEDGLLPIPLPLVRVNTKTGERQVISAGDKNHLRSQSVAYNAVTEQVVALYYQSNNLVIHRPGEEPDVIPGTRLELTDIRGVTEIADTSLIAIMGTYRDVAIMDLRNRELVARYSTVNYEDTHLYYDPAGRT